MREDYIVNYQFHDKEENYHISFTVVKAESIGIALHIADELIWKDFESNGWSDYHITGINIVPELH